MIGILCWVKKPPKQNNNPIREKEINKFDFLSKSEGLYFAPSGILRCSQLANDISKLL